ncbi:hypothetical protein [Stutzerimonas zhaodongensis]|uniref:hypothetical protein n=1 Tax=Stutzerimonas zhaodongensis TaxID=1176257 RepID=UPI0020A6A83A|nr:hypothetical protein [Stutzerimonas zhaodongensis]
MNSIPETYMGVWRRRLLTTSDGCRDETSDVYWLQTAHLHADVRIPHPPPPLPRLPRARMHNSWLCANRPVLPA